jgi:fructose-bisphosphate aldolase / 6-deoxy-5-ketofructose 1-phosphate synthase
MRKTRPRLAAGAAGLDAAFGSDFVKVNYPKNDGVESADALKEAVVAAGRTKVVCAGGERCDVKTLLQRLYDQIHLGGAAGNGTGRNIHQKPPSEAVKFCNAIYAITLENTGVEDAWNACFGD